MAQPEPHTPLFLDTPESTVRFLRDISTARELAVDTEGASFHRFVDRIYLLQISTRDRSRDHRPAGDRRSWTGWAP